MIDSHVHILDHNAITYDWISADVAPLRTNHSVADFLGASKAARLMGVVLVQAAAIEDETRLLLDLGRRESLVKGVVGWVDLLADNADERLDRLAEHGGSLFKGVRLVLDGIDERGLPLDALARGISALAARGQTLDILADWRQLAAITPLLSTEPVTVINHCARPPMSAYERKSWRSALTAVAQRGAFCKFSGLMTAPGVPTFACLRQVANDVIEIFGASRVMWGGDWPVLNLATTYADWLDVSDYVFDDFGQETRDEVFRDVSRRFYQLQVEAS